LEWKVIGGLAGAAAGVATRFALKTAWRKTKGGEPPTNPASPDTTWKEALAWTAASGVAIAVTRLVAQKGAAEAYKKKTGRYPPGLETVSP
jgi:hypothetical protein